MKRKIGRSSSSAVKVLLLSAFLFMCSGARSLPAPQHEFHEIIQLIYKNCKEYNFNVEWALTIFYAESQFKNTSVCEPKYMIKYGKCIQAYGVPQILLRTANSPEVGCKCSGDDLQKNDVAIKYAVKFLSHLFKVYNGDMVKVVSHYRTGKAKYKKYYKMLEPLHKEFCKRNRSKSDSSCFRLSKTQK